MKNRLIKKAYPVEIINTGIEKALNLSRDEIIQGNNRETESNDNLPIYFVSTHNTTIRNCSPYIKSITEGLLLLVKTRLL